MLIQRMYLLGINQMKSSNEMMHILYISTRYLYKAFWLRIRGETFETWMKSAFLLLVIHSTSKWSHVFLSAIFKGKTVCMVVLYFFSRSVDKHFQTVFLDNFNLRNRYCEWKTGKVVFFFFPSVFCIIYLCAIFIIFWNVFCQNRTLQTALVKILLVDKCMFSLYLW